MRTTINEIAGRTVSRGCLTFTIVGIIGAIPAWITHVVVCIQEKEFLFLLVGALVWPVGVIHGVGVWFGAW